MAVTVDLTLNSKDVEASSTRDIKNRWDDYVASLKAAAPGPLKNVFHATPDDDTWSWLAAQQVRRASFTCIARKPLSIIHHTPRSCFV